MPVGVIFGQVEFPESLLGVLDHALDETVRALGAAGELDLAFQRRVFFGVEAIVARALAIHRGLEHRLHVLAHDFRAGDQSRDLFLLAHLPVDEGFDVGVVDVHHHHFGGAPRGAARLDRAGRAVADLQEGHQAGGLAAAGKPFVFGAQRREIGAGAGAVFEQARLAHPQVHDAALVDEVVLDRLDETGVGLRVLIGGFGGLEHAGVVVDEEMALAGAVDAIGPMQAGVEPLRRIGRGDLARQHEAHFVEKGLGVFFRVEIAALPAPIGPGASEPVEHLLGRNLAAETLLFGELGQRRLVGDRAPQERGDGIFLDPLEPGGNPGLAEIFLGQHVAGDLAPGRRNLDPVLGEDGRAVRVADFALGLAELDRLIGRLSRLGVEPLDPHHFPRFASGAAAPQIYELAYGAEGAA